MSHRTISVIVLFSVLFGGKSASATEDSAELPETTVWSSWYWAILDDASLLNIYDTGEALDRYDDYDLLDEPAEVSSNAYERTLATQYKAPGTGEGWEGMCHAWASAAIWERNPASADEYHNGVAFRLRDRKALLTEMYAGITEGNCEILKKNPKPGDLWKILRDNIGGVNPVGGIPGAVIVDVDNSYMVWNQPIYKYLVTYSGTSPNIIGTIELWYAMDTFPQEDPPDPDKPTYWYVDQEEVYTNAAPNPDDPEKIVRAYYDFTGVSWDASGPVAGTGAWGYPGSPGTIFRPKSRSNLTSGCTATDWTCYAANTELEDEYLDVILGECASSDIYVNASATIPGTGRVGKPFNSLQEGLGEVCSGGTVSLADGTYSGLFTISKNTKPMTLRKSGTSATIRKVD